MHPILKVVNWTLVVLLGLLVIALAIMQPKGSLLSAVNIIPFASALVADRPGTRHVGIWIALCVNVIAAIFFEAMAVLAVIWKAASPLLVITLCVLLTIPCALNATACWRKLRPVAKPT
jgi:hypothetical protein